MWTVAAFPVLALLSGKVLVGRIGGGGLFRSAHFFWEGGKVGAGSQGLWERVPHIQTGALRI